MRFRRSSKRQPQRRAASTLQWPHCRKSASARLAAPAVFFVRPDDEGKDLVPAAEI
jgi:hypothetical protein